MRSLIAGVLIALLAGTALAQGKGGHRHGDAKEQKKDDPAKKKAADKAYRDALDRIPNATEKPDPWKTMR